MTVSAQHNGRPIYCYGERWHYDDKPLCPHCNEPQTEDGYDSCIGFIEGAMYACCGHHLKRNAYKTTAYIMWNNGSTKYFDSTDEMLLFLKYYRGE